MSAPLLAVHRRLGRLESMLALCGMWALAACGGHSGMTDPPGEQPLNCAAVPAAPLRLLTRHEYDMSVRDLLGDVSRPGRDFPQEPLSHGLDNDSTLLQVGPDNISRYFEAAESLARQAVQTPVVPNCAGEDASACGRAFLQGFGLRVFRRPLTPEESEVIGRLFNIILAQQGFAAAIEQSIASLLQAPQFLYRDELGAPIGNTSQSQLSAYQTASKLSFFVRGTTPDPELLARAKSGELDGVDGLKRAVATMLAKPDGMDGLARFLSVWLFLDGVELVEKDVDVYPQYNRDLTAAWRKSLELFIADVLRGQASLKGLLTSRVLFINEKMSIYAPKGTLHANPEFVRLENAADRAGGLLSQPGFLAYKGLHNASSPIRRGIFVLDKLLCQPPPSPPADLVIVPPPLSTSLTTRERFNQHRSDPACASCHNIIDPIGFTFENYDGMGLWRTEENGQPINAAGGIVGADDVFLVGDVLGVDELASKLANSRQVHDCVAREIYRYAIGRPLTEADACWFDPIGARFFASGGDFKELVAAIVTSPAFRAHATPLEAR